MRVVLSMTSIPERAHGLPAVLRALWVQRPMPAEIRLYVPEDYPVPLGLGVRLFHVPDLGPLTKLSAVSDTSLPADTLLVTVDDDIYYPPGWLAQLLRAAKLHPKHAVGFSGWNTRRLRRGGSFDFPSQRPTTCDVLEGWAGAAYRKGFFDAERLFEIPPTLKWVDDVWISAHLEARSVRRLLWAKPLAQAGANPGIHTRKDFLEMNRQAVYAWFPKPNTEGR
jgi:hypothetical protein